jgi:hypothetical protein
MKTTLSFLTAAHMSTVLSGQSPHRSVIMIPEGYSDEQAAVVPVGDGARVCVYPDGPSGYVLRRYNGSGQHDWSKRISGPLFQVGNLEDPSFDWYWSPFIPDGNGGLYYCSNAMWEESADGIGTDTLRLSTSLLHLDSEGQPIYHRSIWNEIVAPWLEVAEGDNFQRTDIIRHPDGGLFILIKKWGLYNRTFQIDRIDPQGDLDWSRTYYLPGTDPLHGPVGVDAQYYRLVPDLQGGAYYFDYWVHQLYHFDAEGHCEWARQYHYGLDSTAYDAALPDILVDPVSHDAVLVGDRVGDDLVRKQLYIRVSIDGDPLAAELMDYTFPNDYAPAYQISAGFGIDGKIVSAQYGVGNGYIAFSDFSPGSGQSLRYRATEQTQSGLAYVCHGRRLNTVSGHVQLSGIVHITNVDLGTVETHPILSDIALSDIDGCLLTPTSNPVFSAMDIISVAEKPALLDVATQPMHWMEDSELPEVMNVPAPAISDLCALITALPPLPGARTGGPACTVVAAGEEVRYDAMCEGRLRILDALGRTLISRILPAGSRTELSTTGWPCGVLLFDWRPVDGSAGRADKVVLR